MHEFLFPLYFCNHPIAYAGVKVIFYPIEKNLTKITLLDYKQRETQVLSRGDGYDEPLIRTKEGVNAFVEHFNHVVELKYNKNFDSKSLYSKSNLVIEGHPFWAFYDFLHLVFDICQLDSSKKETINFRLKEQCDPVVISGPTEFHRHVEALAIVSTLISNEKFSVNKKLTEFLHTFFDKFDDYSLLKDSAYFCLNRGSTEKEDAIDTLVTLNRALDGIYGEANVYMRDLTNPYTYFDRFDYPHDDYCLRKKMQFTKRLTQDFSSVIGV